MGGDALRIRSSDGRYMTVGAVEPRFFPQLLTGLGLSPDEVPDQLEIGADLEMHKIFTGRFASKTRDEWSAFVGQALIPVLRARPDASVVMDNLGAHKAERVRQPSRRPRSPTVTCRPTRPT